MVEFHTAGETLEKAKSLLADTDQAIFIVASWGDGACKALGLTRKIAERLTIICNLESGACNPKEMRELRERGVRVFTHSRLHVKVFWTERGVLVGSSNASADGLGFEWEEVNSNIEASIFTKDPEILQRIRKWVDEAVLQQAQIVDETMIEGAEQMWRRRRQARHAGEFVDGEQQSLWSAVISDPSYFCDLSTFVWAYVNEELSDEEERVANVIRRETGISDLEPFVVSKDQIRPPGSYIVDCYYEDGQFQCDGLLRVLDVRPRRVGKGPNYILPFVKEKRLNNFVMDRESKRSFLRFVRSRYDGSSDFDEEFTLETVGLEARTD